MARTRQYSRRRRRGLRFMDILLTCVFFAVIIGSVVMLDGHKPLILQGSVYAADGDSLIMGSRKIRLSGIDAPEFSQTCTRKGRNWPCGRDARLALQKLLRGQTVECLSSGLDRYERTLATCTAGDVDVNAWLVENGWAVDYGGYAREEGVARRGKEGIWSGDFENPQEWRRSHRGDAADLPHSTTRWRDILPDWLNSRLN